MRALRLFVLLLGCWASAQAQWQVLDAHTTADFRGVHYVGEGVAWVSGTNGTVLRTDDMGKTWTHCAVPPGAEKLDFRGVQAFDAKTAIVMSSGPGDASRLYKTSDGCATWKLVFTNPDKDGFFDALSIQFQPRRLNQPSWGYLLGDPVNGEFVLFSTEDGGDSWSRWVAHKRGPKGKGCQLGRFRAKPKDAAFAASNESLITAPYFLFVTGGARARLGFVHHFDLDDAFCDDASKFRDLPLSHGSAAQGAFAIAAKDINSDASSRFVVVGGDYQHPEQTEGTAAFLSRNPENQWGMPMAINPYFVIQKPKTSPHGYRSAVAYDAEKMAWITVGPNGTDVSNDDGRNWRALKPSAGDVADADRNWNALSLPFVVGPHGRIGLLREGAVAGLASEKKTPSR